MDEKKLRFAALIRVSTEKQATQGESLRTQRTQLANSVQYLGGTIAKWYGGQEHATAGWEKKEVERLLGDAQKKSRPFDAVIVADATRWSRDNVASETGLEHLRDHGVQFYVLTKVCDLFDPHDRLFLSLSTTIGAFHASIQKQKSLLNRIERAKRGCPVCGKLPFGRTYNKQTGEWAIDDEKLTIVKDVAKRYLAGERLPDLAEEYELNHSNLHKVLTKRCGSQWEQTFNSDDLKIHENVLTEIPRLLPDAMIEKIKQKAEANRTYQHGHSKNRYLFSRMVFCAHCGYAIFGQANHGEHLYYRHTHINRAKPCNGPKKKAWILAKELERNVIRHIFDCFGNPKAVQRAIEKATPNLGKIKEAQQRAERIEKSLVRIRKGRDRIVRFIAKGTISESHAEQELDNLQEQELRLDDELRRLRDSLENIPTPEGIKAVARQVVGKFRPRVSAKKRILIRDANSNLAAMTWEDRRSLVEMVFSGKTTDGKRMGVYIEWIDGGKNWRYSIHGHFIDVEDWPQMSESRQDAHFTLGSAQQQSALVTKSAWH